MRGPQSGEASEALLLRVEPAQGEPFERQVAAGPVIIGRGADADLLIPDRFLSRHHARLFQWDLDWFIEDLGSRNGTLVDGEAIAEATRIGPGSVISFSGNVVRVGSSVPEPSLSRSASSLTEESLAATVLRPASELLDEQMSPPSPDRQSAPDLLRQAQHLQVLNEVHQALGHSLSQEKLLELILDRVFAHLRPEEAAIYLRAPDGGFQRVAEHRLPEVAGAPPLDSTTLVEEVAVRGLAALVLDARTDERFAAADSMVDSGIRSLVAAPLLDEGDSLGMILLGSRASVRSFSPDDLALLVSLASAAALRLRNVALAREAAERRRMEAEVALARKIQVALLADELPPIPGYEIHTGTQPSRGVSGDFYQVLLREGGREGVVMVVDVSGKGVSASLLTATLEALAADPLEEGRPLDEVCARLSRQLYRRTPPERYATLILASIDLETGALAWVNAGHNPALLLRASGEIEHLGATGVPLGLIPDAEYLREGTVLAPGELLVLYTDGVVETVNGREEQFGLELLETLCRSHQRGSLADLAGAVERETEAFADGVPFEDDRTLVLVRRFPSPTPGSGRGRKGDRRPAEGGMSHRGRGKKKASG